MCEQRRYYRPDAGINIAFQEQNREYILWNVLMQTLWDHAGSWCECDNNVQENVMTLAKDIVNQLHYNDG